MRIAIALFAALLLAPAVARADDEDLRPMNGWEWNPHIEIGSLPWGSYDAFSLGFGLAAGKRIGPTHVFGHAELLPETGYINGDRDDENSHTALTERLSLGVRHAVVRDSVFGDDGLFGLEIGASAGFEHMHFTGGATITRPDVQLDFVADFLSIARHHRYVGFTAGLSITFARAPELHISPGRCAGECAAPSTPAQMDVGVMYVVGFPFAGR
jgi:hypothetical protein